MIDTDKYENITPERWTVDEEDPCRVVDAQDCTIARTDFVSIDEEREWQLANAQLIADAPLLLAEVERLHTMEKFLIGELTNAKQVMITAVRDTLDSFSTCPSCDELTERFVDFIPEGLRDEMLLQRRDPESFWYKGDKND